MHDAGGIERGNLHDVAWRDAGFDIKFTMGGESSYEVGSSFDGDAES